MATNIPPHNLGEVVNACIALIDDPSSRSPALMQHIPGPGFPDGRHHQRRAGDRLRLQDRPRPPVRARAHHDRGRRQGPPGHRHHRAAVPGEQGAPARAHRRAGAREASSTASRSDGLRDESDKDGMRVVIELKRGEVRRHRAEQPVRAHADGDRCSASTWSRCRTASRSCSTSRRCSRPFLRHRREVVTRRTVYDLRKARERAHILEGLAVALANIDEVIAIIKALALAGRRRRWP